LDSVAPLFEGAKTLDRYIIKLGDSQYV